LRPGFADCGDLIETVTIDGGRAYASAAFNDPQHHSGQHDTHKPDGRYRFYSWHEFSLKLILLIRECVGVLPCLAHVEAHQTRDHHCEVELPRNSLHNRESAHNVIPWDEVAVANSGERDEAEVDAICQ